MLTAVHIYNEQGAHIELPIGDGSEYVIRNIDGLEPVNADIITTKYVNMPGGAYQNSQKVMRNPVFTIGFDPNYTTDDPFGVLRRALYPYLAPGKKVDLRFFSNNFPTVRLYGYVESFEAPFFTQDPEYQISVVCPYPFFAEIQPRVIPFGTPSVKTATLTVDNVGNVDTGFLLTIEDYFSSTMGGFTLSRTNVSPSSMQYVEQLANLEETVAIQINTVQGQKSAYWKLQSGYSSTTPFAGTSVLGYMNKWLSLVPGVNNLSLVYVATFPPVTARASLSYIPKYEGL